MEGPVARLNVTQSSFDIMEIDFYSWFICCFLKEYFSSLHKLHSHCSLCEKHYYLLIMVGEKNHFKYSIWSAAHESLRLFIALKLISFKVSPNG